MKTNAEHLAELFTQKMITIPTESLAEMNRLTDWCLLLPPQGEDTHMQTFSYEDGLVPPQEPAVIANYKRSAYRCPGCGRRLYKVIFPKGNDPRLVFNDTTGDAVEPARVFTCPECFRFFAAMKGKHLTGRLGEVVMAMIEPQDNNLYLSWFAYFNQIGDLYAQRDE